MKDGKFIFEATVNIEKKCSLSDPNGGLAQAWPEQWDVAVLRISNYNPSCETWCVRNHERISEVRPRFNSRLLMDETEILKKSQNDSKENHLRYVTHMTLYSM